VILDEREGPLAPGASPEAAGAEIEVELRFGKSDEHPPHVQVLGTPWNDSMTAAPVSGQRFGVNLNAQADRADADADADLILAAPPASIELKLHGEGGADRLDARGADAGSRPVRSLLLSGEAGSDLVFGTNRPDHFDGGAGADRIFGRGGRDFGYAGFGRDRVFGGSGDDWIYGSHTAERLGAESNFYSGGAGSDRISAWRGGRDTIRCGSGYDELTADLQGSYQGGHCELLRGPAA
jgi:Ca2+-binding RTX toxin-like protein